MICLVKHVVQGVFAWKVCENLGNVAFQPFFFLSRYLDGFEFNFLIRIFSENFSLSTPDTSHNSLNFSWPFLVTIKKHSEKLFFVCSCLYSLSNSHIYLKKLKTKKIIINKFSFTCFIFYVFKKSTKVFFFNNHCQEKRQKIYAVIKNAIEH